MRLRPSISLKAGHDFAPSDSPGEESRSFAVSIGKWRLFRTSGMSFGIPKSTANTIKRELCELLKSRASDFIKFPRSAVEVQRSIDGFQEASPFPQVVGAIDGTHIRIG